ncbi:MAG: rod shape-determining protein MreC [Calditrichaeota bacterium]|nr:MAG: rod shape-determining protein MreC [Calditrichota bacterium]
MRFHFLLPIFRKPHYLLLVYVGLSFFLMSLNPPAELRGIRMGVLALVEFWSGIQESLTRRQVSRKELEALKEENFRLQLSNQRLREVLLENIRLHRLLNLSRELDVAYVSARVIGLGTERDVQSIILNVGSRDGVGKNMPVVNADGLVGKVIAVTPGQAVVQILLDHNSLVSARLQQSRELGIVSWDGSPWLRLQYIPKSVAVSVGEPVVTSGLSNIYPPGLKIGVVVKVSEDRRGFFKNIRVKPAVDFNRLEEVFVIVGEKKTPAEKAAS